MKRKTIYILLIIMSIFMVNKVNAEEMGACAVTDLAKLRQDAANVKVSYVAQRKAENNIMKRYFEIKIFNLPSTVYATVQTAGNRVQGNVHQVDYTKKGPDGAVTLTQDALGVTVEYVINVYSNKGNCYGDLLRTFKLTIPKFNQYSELRACEEIPEFYMCQEYVTFDIDGSKFYDAVDAYKKKTAGDSETPTLESVHYAEDPLNISNHKYFIVGAIILLGVGLTAYIIIRKKKEVK